MNKYARIFFAALIAGGYALYNYNSYISWHFDKLSTLGVFLFLFGVIALVLN